MSSLENVLHQVEFHDLDLNEDDMRTTPIPNDTPPVPAPILPVPSPITPVTPRGFNAAMQPFVAVTVGLSPIHFSLLIVLHHDRLLPSLDDLHFPS
jgi:hypothetical protein